MSKEKGKLVDRGGGPEEERRLLKKMDIRLIPLVTLLYVLSFLDRVNIGNAKLADIEVDLGLRGDQYNWAIGIFFVGYVIFEVPSNIMLVKTRPSTWLPTIMIGWGTVMTLTAIVKSFEGLLVARFFLGAFEAGLFPGIVFFITMWYIRSEQNFRIGLIVSGSALAGAFSGLLSYIIVLHLDGTYGFSGWQWIFIIDGIVTILVAFIAFFLITDYPGTAMWLTEEERHLITDRLKRDAGDAYAPHFTMNYVLEAIRDWKVWNASLVYIGITIAMFSFSFFNPAIVNGMGFDEVTSQLLAAPPFLIGCIDTIVVTVLSDRLSKRGPFLFGCLIISIIGYILLIIPDLPTAGKYTGACIVGGGLFPCVPTTITWLNNNLAGNVKRATGSAIMIAFGNVGGIIAAQVYQPKDSPDYQTGHVITLCCLIVSLFSAVLFYVFLRRENRIKNDDPAKLLEGKTDTEIKDMGDLHPTFIYSL
ncbi:1375_t:CDS:10 [Acaulospora morrowiae]|uniref:1375_t:CDS:1 n=1 Tax=Acaulospora morrowiae TaxID=94023 RepID=A0A9N9F4C8_9GLOM|nr:1375_t:CDS:10 [Acaulospora morrowiae]